MPVHRRAAADGGSWGTSSADIQETVERVTFGIHIGNTTITLWNVVYAVTLLIIGVLLARGLQKWMATKLLPGTGIEASLQPPSPPSSAMWAPSSPSWWPGEIGLNLQNIALVAGALSVGIGFGLQSIISNFVSGLILLTERPIRVGDTINVKGEKATCGASRALQPRSRPSSGRPSSSRTRTSSPHGEELDALQHHRRVIVAVNIAYDADVEEVRDILVACACDHPQVLQTPPPRVFITKFADTGIVFELRCVVANVDYSLTVKSDLHFSILRRFRKHDIVMTSQPWAALSRAPADLVPPHVDADPEPPAVEAKPSTPVKGGGSISDSTG